MKFFFHENNKINFVKLKRRDINYSFRFWLKDNVEYFNARQKK